MWKIIKKLYVIDHIIKACASPLLQVEMNH